MKARKWTHDARKYMYQRIMSEFGPIKEWKGATVPEGGHKKLVELFSKLTKELNILFDIEVSIGAIDNQFRWGTQCCQKKLTHPGHMQVYILNRSMAMEIGLVSLSEIGNIDYIQS